jgi:uncharacterized protein (UPF0333 family)
MKLLKKLVSKKGQLSMEMGLLIAAAVLVAVIVAYYYTTRTKAVMERAGASATNVTEKLGNGTVGIAKELYNMTLITL